VETSAAPRRALRCRSYLGVGFRSQGAFPPPKSIRGGEGSGKGLGSYVERKREREREREIITYMADSGS